MAFPFHGPAVPLASLVAPQVYDYRDHCPYPDEGDLLEPGPRARYEQLAADIRADIYAGTWAAGQRIPYEPELAARFGVSRALVNRALVILADEELISQEQGRGTFVLPRRVYRVTVSVPVPAGCRPGSATALRKAVTAAAKAEPAVTEVGLTGIADGAALVVLLIEAADGDWAVHIAKLVVKASGKPWSWDGWNLRLATYHCAPAEATQ
jgi:DNA-binding transcriptional regulator YhcF (GntR family)